MPYNVECWAIKKSYVHKMNVAEMKMLKWILGNIRKNKIKDEVIHKMVKVVPIKDKLRKRSFEHLQH